MSKLNDLTNKHDSPSSLVSLGRMISTYSRIGKKSTQIIKKEKPNLYMNLISETKFDRIFGKSKCKTPTNPLKVVSNRIDSSLADNENVGQRPYRYSSTESDSSPDCKKTSLPTVEIIKTQHNLSNKNQIKLFDSNEDLPPLPAASRNHQSRRQTIKRKPVAESSLHNSKFKPLLESTNLDLTTPKRPTRKASHYSQKSSTPCHSSQNQHNKMNGFSLFFSPITNDKNQTTKKPKLNSFSNEKTSNTNFKRTKSARLKESSKKKVESKELSVVSPRTERSDSILSNNTILNNLDSKEFSCKLAEKSNTQKSNDFDKSNVDLSESIFDHPNNRRLSLNNSLRVLAEQFLHRNSDFCKQMSNPNVAAKDKLLLMCDPAQVVSFSSALPKKLLKSCRKIAEGSYGEIFRTTETSGTNSIIKVVSVEDNRFEQLLPEVLVSLAFNQLQERCENFIRTSRCMLVSGAYPKVLEQEWRRYDAKHKSLNNFPSGRQHLLFTLDNGGECLEHYQFDSTSQAISVFEQVLCSLAMAERAFSFEHRDLHWGNVLISPEAQSTFNYRLGDQQFDVETHGLHCRIIDFSLSRASIGEMVFHADLSADSSLFTGKGDIQFDVYRQMRTLCNNDWKHFCPKTNILWLHYLLEKLSFKCRSLRRRNGMEANRRLRFYLTNILKYESAVEAMSLFKTD